MPFGINKLHILGGIAVVTIIGLGYLHYTSLLEDISRLKQTNQQLVISNKSKDVTIGKYSDTVKEWKESQDQYIKDMKELREISIKSQEEVQRLHGIFSKHNIEKLAINKPTLLEKRVNSGTANAFRMFECSSGSADSSCSSGDRETESN